MESEQDTRGPRERVYDEEFSPLVRQLIALSKKHNIPMVASWELDKRDDGVEMLCTTLILPEGSCDRLRNAKRALYPGSGLLAMTLVGGESPDDSE